MQLLMSVELCLRCKDLKSRDWHGRFCVCLSNIMSAMKLGTALTQPEHRPLRGVLGASDLSHPQLSRYHSTITHVKQCAALLAALTEYHIRFNILL